MTLCVEADRDGVPGVQDSDCATVTVTMNAVELSGSASDSGDGSASTVVGTDNGVDTITFDWSFTALDDPNEDDVSGGNARIGVGTVDQFSSNPEFVKNFYGGESGSGTATIDTSGYTGDIYLIVDDGDGSVSPP